ncbi:MULTISPECIES: YdcH family protein [Pseudovibrio]|uniref:YdcH family protein n=1 Tax=Stappiaceae TaxID=2821832 RepID=UPI0023656218|nr:MULTISPECIES: DUF465 domain-containing protein [Pseudovibrio]MDD7911883.1 DUF465 domain-containing protein [Pseudovibrio exalbescens]MDX5595451.1 DUF465 domain-containing protein [Pseudovibrio sp. SPO723]
MSIHSHLSELERRHATLEREIESAAHHPSTDSLELSELKRRKLQIKDEISKLRTEKELH